MPFITAPGASPEEVSKIEALEDRAGMLALTVNVERGTTSLGMNKTLADTYDNEDDVDTVATTAYYDAVLNTYAAAAPTYDSVAFNDGNKNTDATTPYTVTETSAFSNRFGWFAFDSNVTGTEWHVDTSGGEESMTIDLGTAQIMHAYRFSMEIASSNGVTDWRIEASNTGAFAGEEDILHTVAGHTPANGYTSIYEFASPASYRYYRFVMVDSVGTYGIVEDWDLRLQITNTGNYIVQSNTITAAAQPDYIRGILLYEDISGNSVLNTDIKLYYSRDDGATWKETTLEPYGNYNANVQFLSTGIVDMALEASGTQVKYKIETFNSKDQRIHGNYIQYS